MATNHCHDLTGLKCPLPIIRLSRIVKGLAPGEECTLFADDPAFCPDVEAWCRKTRNCLVRCEQDGDRTVVVIKKTATAIDAADGRTAGITTHCDGSEATGNA